MANPRKIASLVAVSAAIIAMAGNGPAPSPGSKDAKPASPIVELAGATWHGSFDQALLVAKSEGKPVLHFQMFGRLDDAYC